MPALSFRHLRKRHNSVEFRDAPFRCLRRDTLIFWPETGCRFECWRVIVSPNSPRRQLLSRSVSRWRISSGPLCGGGCFQLHQAREFLVHAWVCAQKRLPLRKRRFIQSQEASLELEFPRQQLRQCGFRVTRVIAKRRAQEPVGVTINFVVERFEREVLLRGIGDQAMRSRAPVKPPRHAALESTRRHPA